MKEKRRDCNKDVAANNAPLKRIRILSWSRSSVGVANAFKGGYFVSKKFPTIFPLCFTVPQKMAARSY